MTARRNVSGGPALPSENNDGSSAWPVGGEASQLGATAAPGETTGRSGSATGETLTRRHQRAERPPASGERTADDGHDPFSRWVDRQLRTLYGPVADEPIPPKLRELIDRNLARPDGDGRDADDPDRDGRDGEEETGGGR